MGNVGIKSIKKPDEKYLSAILKKSFTGTISPSGVYSVMKFFTMSMAKIDSNMIVSTNGTF